MDPPEKRPKERKLSLSFIRKSLSRKQRGGVGGAEEGEGEEVREGGGASATADEDAAAAKGRRGLLRHWRRRAQVLVLRGEGPEQAPPPEPPPRPDVTPRVRPPGVSGELAKLAREGWYWGPVSRDEAVDRLRGQPDGTFLVRDSTSDSYLFTVSFRSSGKTLHSRIDYDGHGYSLHSSLGFESVAQLIGHSMRGSRGAIYCYSQPNSPTQPEFPVRLSRPLSRFTQMRSLQYLCRFVIRQHTGLTDIQKLPLPPCIKGYIQEGHY